MLFLSLPLTAQTTYFVSLDGSDANDGLSEATSWRTFSFAASSNSPVKSGDKVYIKAGDYGLDDVFIDKNYSEGDKRISFIGYRNSPDDITDFDFKYGDDVDASKMPLINPGNRLKGEGVNLSDIYNITIKNLQIAKSIAGISIWNTEPINSNHILENIFIKTIGDDYSSALSVKEGNRNIIKNCLIVNATGAGMDVWGDNNTIENCKVYSNENELLEGGTYSSMDYYIVLKGDSNVVRNCYIERDGILEDVGHGMEIKENGEHNLFVDCTAKNMVGGCFSVRWSGVKNNEFRNCKAISTLDDDITAFLIRDGASNNVFNSCISENCQAGVRFLLSGEDVDYCGEHNVFNNCIIKNATWVFDLNSWYYNSAPADNNRLVNCTIDKAQYLINADRPNTGNQFVNCIITNVENYLAGEKLANLEFSHNDFYDNGFNTPDGVGNITQNPLFENTIMGDYHLTKNSPCIDAATGSDAPKVDFEGTSRPQGNGFDMGAYEFIATTAVLEAYQQEDLIFPNPTHSQLWVSDKFGNSSYEIISTLGETISKGHINNNEIDISNLSDGLWIVKLNDGLREYDFWIVKD